MKVYEKELRLKKPSSNKCLIDYFNEEINSTLAKYHSPIRFAVTRTDECHFHCEIGIVQHKDWGSIKFPSIFEFENRKIENTKNFNAILLVPTGIGASIGGHAGDATPIARLLSSVCDKLITHPNVVNASDINEMPENTLYLEGSVITRLLMGTIGISEVYSNRVLAVIEEHNDELFSNAAVNAVNAAIASYGLDCSKIVKLKSELLLKAEYSTSGTAVGRVENLDKLHEILTEHQDEYDAVAIASIINVPREYHAQYFKSHGEMVNPWGGAEAIFTHTLSSILNVPTAHSPMLEDQLIANFDPGIVDSRMAAEAISLTFLQCILKGLQRAPKIITDKESMNHHSVYTASDVSCLIVPDGVLGLPILSALEQGIKVIAVKENKNLMKNDLSELPWKQNQFIRVENYFEALGVMTAIKEGLLIESLRRPLKRRTTREEKHSSPDIQNISLQRI